MTDTDENGYICIPPIPQVKLYGQIIVWKTALYACSGGIQSIPGLKGHKGKMGLVCQCPAYAIGWHICAF